MLVKSIKRKIDLIFGKCFNGSVRCANANAGSVPLEQGEQTVARSKKPQMHPQCAPPADHDDKDSNVEDQDVNLASNGQDIIQFQGSQKDFH